MVDGGAAKLTGTNSAATNRLPVANNTTYVKAFSHISTGEAHFSTDLARSVIGNPYADACWLADVSDPAAINKRFNVDLGAAYAIGQVVIDNFHESGRINMDRGVGGFAVYASNNAADMSVKTGDGSWTLIQSGLTARAHVAADVADPQTFTLTNTQAYRYWSIKIASNLGDAADVGWRRIVFQERVLAYLSGVPVTVATNDTGHVNSADWTSMVDASITAAANSQAVFLAVSFTGRDSWKVWTGTAWRMIASKLNADHGGLAGNWYWQDGSSVWHAATVNDMLACLSEATAVAANQMTPSALDDIDAHWNDAGGFTADVDTIDLSATFSGNGSATPPTVTGVSFNLPHWQQITTGLTITILTATTSKVKNASGSAITGAVKAVTTYVV